MLLRWLDGYISGVQLEKILSWLHGSCSLHATLAALLHSVGQELE